METYSHPHLQQQHMLYCEYVWVWSRSVARKETLGVHQKNWVCHIYCQINAQKKTKKQACLLGINMLV